MTSHRYFQAFQNALVRVCAYVLHLGTVSLNGDLSTQVHFAFLPQSREIKAKSSEHVQNKDLKEGKINFTC